MAIIKNSWKTIIEIECIAHLIRSWVRFNQRLGGQFSAALTYFSFLSFIPLLMLMFAVGGFFLASRPEVLQYIFNYIAHIVNEQHLVDVLEKIVTTAVKQRTVVGVTGLLIALYSGVNWIASLREAIRAQFASDWQVHIEGRDPFYILYLKDLGRLIMLAIGVVVMIGMTTLATALKNDLIVMLHLHQISWFREPLMFLSMVISIFSCYVIYLWIYWMMSNRQISKRSMMKGSFMAALCVEVIKFLMVIIIPHLVSSPSGAAFGSIIGLLACFYLIAYITLFWAAWIATCDKPVDELIYTQAT